MPSSTIKVLQIKIQHSNWNTLNSFKNNRKRNKMKLPVTLKKEMITKFHLLKNQGAMKIQMWIVLQQVLYLVDPQLILNSNMLSAFLDMNQNIFQKKMGQHNLMWLKKLKMSTTQHTYLEQEIDQIKRYIFIVLKNYLEYNINCYQWL